MNCSHRWRWRKKKFNDLMNFNWNSYSCVCWSKNDWSKFDHWVVNKMKKKFTYIRCHALNLWWINFIYLNHHHRFWWHIFFSISLSLTTTTTTTTTTTEQFNSEIILFDMIIHTYWLAYYIFFSDSQWWDLFHLNVNNNMMGE